MAGPQVTDRQQTLDWATEELTSRMFGDRGALPKKDPLPFSPDFHYLPSFQRRQSLCSAIRDRRFKMQIMEKFTRPCKRVST